MPAAFHALAPAGLLHKNSPHRFRGSSDKNACDSASPPRECHPPARKKRLANQGRRLERSAGPGSG